jgi:inorganic pyrophosphatase
MEKELQKIWREIRTILKAHPWHGVHIGDNYPEIVTSYIEIVPTDTVKYEIDKHSGILTIDRPQMYSNICPTPYGFIPQTYCGDKVAEFCREKTGRDDIKGDGDPLDICVLTEKAINQGNILLKAIPIGGLRMIDNNEADDKIIAVMKGDSVYGGWKDITDCPEQLIDRLKHYFLTYKEAPGKHRKEVEITHLYNKEEAQEIIRRSYDDYLGLYGNINELLKAGK